MPVLLRGIGNAYPGEGLDGDGLKGIGLKPDEVGVNEGDAVESAPYPHGFGESSRAGRTFDAADKDGLGAFRGAGYDVEHVMDAVAEVDIGLPALTVHNLGAGRSAVVGVAGSVLFAQVAFGFGYAAADYGAVSLTDTEDFSANLFCGAVGILKIEFPTEYQSLASSAGM